MEKTRAKEDLAEPEVKVVKVESKKKKDTGPREPTPEELKKAIMKTCRICESLLAEFRRKCAPKALGFFWLSEGLSSPMLGAC